MFLKGYINDGGSSRVNNLDNGSRGPQSEPPLGAEIFICSASLTGPLRRWNTDDFATLRQRKLTHYILMSNTISRCWLRLANQNPRECILAPKP